MCAHLGCHVCWFERIYSSSTRQRYTLAFQKIKVCWIWYMSVHSFYFQTNLALLFLFVFVCVKQFRVACCAAIDVYCLFCFVFLSFPTMVDFTFLQLPHNRTSITVLNRIHFRTTAIRFPTWLDASLLNGNGVNSEELLDLRPAQHSTFQTWIERQCFFLFILRLFSCECFAFATFIHMFLFFIEFAREFKIKFNTNAQSLPFGILAFAYYKVSEIFGLNCAQPEWKRLNLYRIWIPKLFDICENIYVFNIHIYIKYWKITNITDMNTPREWVEKRRTNNQQQRATQHAYTIRQ